MHTSVVLISRNQNPMNESQLTMMARLSASERVSVCVYVTKKTNNNTLSLVLFPLTNSTVVPQIPAQLY